jgi:hypothetical protein
MTPTGCHPEIPVLGVVAGTATSGWPRGTPRRAAMDQIEITKRELVPLRVADRWPVAIHKLLTVSG